ncbi:MAG: hypothetical protein WKF92_08760 [Pyrinomonadaceae bacterium]
MFLSNPAKSFLAGSLVLIISAGCGSGPDNQNTNVPIVPEIKSELPFSTKEPENFQCEMVVTAGETVRTTFIAKKGGKRRIDYNSGETNQRSFLQNDRDYIISYDKKIYAEIAPAQNSGAAEGPWDEFTSRLLNERSRAGIEEIGSEGSLKIYKIIIGESNLTEILIYIDPAIGIPARQEFFSVSGDRKTLQYSFEFKNLVLEVDDSLFEIPKNLRKVSPANFNLK